MKLPCFSLNHGKNESGKRLYQKRPTSAKDLPGVGDVAEWIDWKGSKKTDLPSWGKKDPTAGALKKAKKSLPTRPSTPRPKEKMKIRFQKEIFGTKEIQRWYMERVKEALEKLDGDRLHRFISLHQKFNKGSITQWNREYAALLGLNVPKEKWGGSEQMKNKRIVAATQHVLVDYYNNDVFQLTVKKVNPWIWIDGKYGPYTNSVMGDYWNGVHGPTSKKPRLNRADLGQGYPKGGGGRKTYAAAMAWLTEKLAESKPGKVEPQKDKPTEVQMAEKVKDRDARQHYRTLDTDKGKTISLRHLAIKHHDVEKDHNGLLLALSEAYKQAPKPPNKAKKLYRAMHLLALQKGDKVNKMEVKKGDVLKIMPNGVLQVLKEGNRVRHEIKMKDVKA